MPVCSYTGMVQGDVRARREWSPSLAGGEGDMRGVVGCRRVVYTSRLD